LFDITAMVNWFNNATKPPMFQHRGNQYYTSEKTKEIDSIYIPKDNDRIHVVIELNS